MQNTIIREFEHESEVVAVIFDQGGANGETRAWLETFWSSYFLRGGVLWDETGATGAAYGQPNTGLPFGRGFVIDRDGTVALPYFGHRPQMATAFIRSLLSAGGVGVRGGADPEGGGRWSETDRGQALLGSLRVVPNPVRGAAEVVYRFSVAGVVTIRCEVFDAAGRRAWSCDDGPLPLAAGSHRFPLAVDWTQMPSGVLYLRLQAGGDAVTTRLAVVR